MPTTPELTDFRTYTYGAVLDTARNLLAPLDHCDTEYARGQIELIADLFGIPMDLRDQIARDIGFPPPFVVGVNDGPVLRRFDTEREAAEFISTLEGAQDGLYYLDGPEKVLASNEVLT